MAESDLFALLEMMLRTFANVPRVKPGGHPEEIFLELTDEEREDIECSICYQILKETRQCENKHKFCHSCIFVWSTSGSPVNHSRCPVCRVEGIYVRNNELDDKINNKRVKCSLKTCKWKGVLKSLTSHQHTNYSETAAATSPAGNVSDSTSELPALRSTPGARPQSRTRARASVSQSTHASSSQSSLTSRNNNAAQRQPLGNSSSNNANQTTRTVSQRSPGNQGSSTTRSRTRSRTRNASPQRRSNLTATGLPTNGRLTSRARIRNTGNESNSVQTQAAPVASQTTGVNNENVDPTEQTTTEVVRTPRPPTTPRPAGQVARRLPTLPGLVSMNHRQSESQTGTVDTNNNVSQSPTGRNLGQTPESPRQFPPETLVRRPGQRSFGMIRERLNESRNRLDTLMSAFSSEIDRGRQDLTDFQTERERRRQEQMAEVRDLGRRLTHVANELRGLLSQRRQIRSQIDHLVDAASDDPD